MLSLLARIDCGARLNDAKPSTLDRYRGCLIGLAVGDAVGTTVEFRPRDSFPPMTDMTGGGPFKLAAGQWTDDTSMALCLAHSLLARGGFDALDQMTRYLNWRDWGYLSSTGRCFDIGGTVAAALDQFDLTRDPLSGSISPDTAGNGSIMRLAPIPLFFHPSLADVIEFSGASSRTTHGASEAIECCTLLGYVIHRCLQNVDKADVLDASDLALSESPVAALAGGSYFTKTRDQIRGSGYAVHSLEASLWCFKTTSTFAEAILEAVNLGDDADTTAAVTGQIAGAFYGVDAIPPRWRSQLHMIDEIERLADDLYSKRVRAQNSV